MTRRSLRLLAAAACVWSAPAGVRGQQPPVFRSRVELTSVDVNVVDARGRPIADLAPADFSVRIDRQPRRVVSAQWVDLTGGGQAAPALPAGYSSNEGSTGGRLIVLAVDEPNIRFGGASAIQRAASAFIDKLSPSDRVAVIGLAPDSPAVPFTSDFARAKQAIDRMNGKSPSLPTLRHSISVSEAIAIHRRDPGPLDEVVYRECPDIRRTPNVLATCTAEVREEADELAQLVEEQGSQTVRALGALFNALRNINGPKTVVLISEGFAMADADRLADEIGEGAAAARASVYVLQLEQQAFDLTSAQVRPNLDRQTRMGALESLAGAARGAVLQVSGSGSAAFDRIQSELSGYYLLGVESDIRDRDGRPHAVDVDVRRSGVTVRAARRLLDAGTNAPARSPQQEVAAGLASPLPLSALPVRVATFALQGPEAGRVQVLIHAEIGTDAAAARVVSTGYLIFDSAGRVVENERATPRLSPVMNGVPSPLQFSAGASLPPGDYTLRFVAADGDRAGSVEHPLHASLTTAASVAFSELIVGGPSDAREFLQPTVGYTVNFGIVHGYLEAYGPQSAAVTVKYEIAAEQNGAALLSVDAPGRLGGDDRMIFTVMMPVTKLPAGKYVLRARVSSAGKPLRTVARDFEVAPPPVLMTPAEGTGSAPVVTEVFLPINEQALSRPFSRDEALKADVLDVFRGRLSANASSAFEAGVAALASGDFAAAEGSFKLAIQPDADSTTGLTYLAVTYAASGHDPQAIGAWQTALTEGSDMPQIYDWLAQALLRTHALAEARTLLEEAADKWPSDTRFIAPLSLLYATFGKGLDAVRMLERHLDAQPDDLDSFRLGVEWLYQVHAAGAIVHSRAEDVKLAHAWADRYGDGPQQALVRQWVSSLDREVQ